MGDVFDRYGGADAWDRFCAERDDELKELQLEDPGCESCSHYEPCPCGCGWGRCDVGGEFVDKPECEYEGYAA